MKIDPSVSQNNTDIGSTAKGSSATAGAGTSVPAAQSDATSSNAASSSSSGEVNLSPLSSTLRSGGTDVGDIDLQTVQQIKDAISSNQLPIDTSKIADGLLDSVRSFLKTS
ncbi:flagellar biosynthesis anti-sigma factor FlgM [Pararobbsia silviterrae]|uniref:flagellar biosynthesis anti-sigma factor FlgM n=1 Tax=Pararobbsia silviterrae TaxID=1792498 RepID=UPI001313F0CB|nr:flagellar biosynthesis anti-sigma factor FlgM [Pararobbsia silviterrae]